MRTYTQTTVAWPEKALDEPWHTEQILINDEGGGDATFTFCKFSGDADAFGRQSAEHAGVSFDFFMDGKELAFSLIGVIAQMTDEWTPEQLIEALTAQGYEPSEYHARGAEQIAINA